MVRSDYMGFVTEEVHFVPVCRYAFGEETLKLNEQETREKLATPTYIQMFLIDTINSSNRVTRYINFSFLIK
jgi:intein/homing endonuclease